MRDRFQFAAFKAFFKAAKMGDLSNEEAFASAIIKSSDEETKRVLKKDPGAIIKWQRSRKRGKQID